jgi:hypothetical protein
MNAEQLIDELIAKLADWRGETIANLRRIIHEVDPEIIEEWKWKGNPVFSDHGIVCVVGAFKDKVKLTFYQGAGLPDPDKLFNSELEGKQWRAIDLFKSGQINESSLKVLLGAAVEFNKAREKPLNKKKVHESE